MYSQPYNQLSHIKANLCLLCFKGYYSDISSTVGHLLNSNNNSNRIYHPLNTYQDLYTVLSVLHALFHLILTTALRNWRARGNTARGRIWSQTLPGFESCFSYLLAVELHPSFYRWGNYDSDKKKQSQVISQEQMVKEAETMKYKISYGKWGQVKMDLEGGGGGFQKRTTITNGSTKWS